jgi:hypothetical protein
MLGNGRRILATSVEMRWTAVTALRLMRVATCMSPAKLNPSAFPPPGRLFRTANVVEQMLKQLTVARICGAGPGGIVDGKREWRGNSSDRSQHCRSHFVSVREFTRPLTAARTGFRFAGLFPTLSITRSIDPSQPSRMYVAACQPGAFIVVVMAAPPGRRPLLWASV